MFTGCFFFCEFNVASKTRNIVSDSGNRHGGCGGTISYDHRLPEHSFRIGGLYFLFRPHLERDD